MYLACHTQQEIADEVGLSQPQTADAIKTLSDFPNLEKSIKNLADFSDPDFETPIPLKIVTLYNAVTRPVQQSHRYPTLCRVMHRGGHAWIYG